MERFLGSKSIFTPAETRIHRRTERLLQELGISVDIENEPDFPCLLVGTHPSIWTATFYRRMKNTVQVVYADALKRTGIEAIDRLIGISLAHMLPVKRSLPDMNRRTFDVAASLIDQGYKVMISPTGKTDMVDLIPNEPDLRLGGIIGILKRTRDRVVVPTLIYVDGEIREDSTVEAGSRVRVVCSSNPLDFGNLNLDKYVDPNLMVPDIVRSWREIETTL